MRPRRALAAIGVLLWLPLHAGQASVPGDARDWIEKHIGAPSKVSYEGEMVYSQGGKMSTLGVVHRVEADGVHERIYALDGAPSEVVSDSRHLACDTPGGGDKSLAMQRDKPVDGRARLADDVARIGKHYRVSVGDHHRIANRNTQRIDLMPTGDFRYGHRLWLDSATGVALKTQLVSGD